jgi:uncharacterized DUF497 family protein
MDVRFDSAKSEKNLLARGISFELAAKFEWDSALVVEDVNGGLKARHIGDGSRI